MLTKNPLSGLAPSQSDIDFNFLLKSSLVIFTLFYFSSSFLWFVNLFCIRLMLDFCTPYSFLKCSFIFSICWFCLFLFTFKILGKSSLVDLEISVFLKLIYFVVISFYFSYFCSYSLFHPFHYQCNSFPSQPILLI